MGRLSQNERDGLEDLFLSIQANQDRYQRVKDLATLLLSKESKRQLKKSSKWLNMDSKRLKSLIISLKLVKRRKI